MARESLRQGPVRPAVVAQRLVKSAANPAPETNAPPVAGAMVDARALIITANGSDPDFGAIQSTLQYLGTPFDVLNATTGPALTAGMLATGNHGKYNAIFLETGQLSVGGTSAFSADEWNVLATYEAQFGVRRVSLYTSPTTAYGLSDAGEVDPSKTPVTMTCTPTGATTFVGANCANPIVVDQGWVYPATVADSTTTPLLVDGAGHVYAALHTSADGREELALTFAQAYYYNAYLELAYGLVSWATRGLFIGERHVYAVPQLDDLFLASALYTGPKTQDRITDTDLQTFANWQNGKRAQPQFAGFRVAFACNGYGSHPGDPLTARAVALGSTFAWINHTWDHPELDNLSYADVMTEFTKNDAFLKGLPLTPYASISAVTPNISGLASADAMQAIHDVGIRYLVSDTSQMGQDNPSPNVGIWNALQPTVLEIPRIPSELYFNVEDPSTWIPEYEAVKKVTSIDYATIIDQQSDALAGYMLAGNKDPWMFHQLNIYDYDGAGHSLLTDLLDATFAKYAAAATFPVTSPTEDELAAIFINRMAFQGSGATATIQPGASITVTVTNAATVPVTGLCTPGAESYGGQTISYLNLSAGQSVTLPLSGCSGGAGGAGGMGGAGGAAGSGSAGSPGAAGSGGVASTGGGGMAGTGVSTGVGGMAGTGIGGAQATGGTGGAGGGAVVTGTGGVAGTGGTPATGGTGGVGGMGGVTVVTGAGGTAGMGGAPPPIGGGGGGVLATGGVGGVVGSGGTGGVAATGGVGGMAGASGGTGGVTAPGGAGGAPATGAGGAGDQAGAGGGHGGGGGGAFNGGGHAGGAGHGGGAGAGGVAGNGAMAQGGQAGIFSGGSGCSCDVGTSPTGSGALFLTLLGAALGIRPRRRG